jgi:hypothetical protein
MVFAKKDRCLYVVTSGGPPEEVVEGDAHIETVNFGRRPCLRE